MSVYSPINWKPRPVCQLPRETVLSAKRGSVAYTGRAKAMKIAGVEVIVIGRNMAELEAVFNHVEAHLHGGVANMPEPFIAMLSPEVAMVAKESLTYDDEL